ncbi:hypothetical protein VPNG_07712 [Cytospora leucostoma]|uniref:Uncharacterized protein n=1 Tax=Cytospora leucostoma TaxID=1230097 RepID=A0A423W8C4_9PEZI|nr:hypothetical protein VPNG_07712 [Cytospora leucostoma]
MRLVQIFFAANAINGVLAGHCGSLPPGVQGPCWPTIFEAPEFHLNIAGKDIEKVAEDIGVKQWVDEAGRNLQENPVGTVIDAVKDVGGIFGGIAAIAALLCEDTYLQTSVQSNTSALLTMAQEPFSVERAIAYYAGPVSVRYPILCQAHALPNPLLVWRAGTDKYLNEHSVQMRLRQLLLEIPVTGLFEL